MTNKWRKLLKLSRPERNIFVEALLTLAVIGLMLRLFGFGLSAKFLDWIVGLGAGAGPLLTMGRINRIAHLVNVAAYNLPRRANCLDRSVVLWWMLSRRGLITEVRFGARREANGLAAHAWVEFNGIVLNDSEDIAQEYVPLTTNALATIKGCLIR
jgi:hypothetical protein